MIIRWCVYARTTSHVYWRYKNSWKDTASCQVWHPTISTSTTIISSVYDSLRLSLCFWFLFRTMAACWIINLSWVVIPAKARSQIGYTVQYFVFLWFDDGVTWCCTTWCPVRLSRNTGRRLVKWYWSPGSAVCLNTVGLQFENRERWRGHLCQEGEDRILHFIAQCSALMLLRNDILGDYTLSLDSLRNIHWFLKFAKASKRFYRPWGMSQLRVGPVLWPQHWVSV